MNTKLKRAIILTVTYIALTILAFIMLFPVIYALFASFKTTPEILTAGINILPEKFQFDNYVKAFKYANFSRFTLNSIYYSGCIVMGSILTSTVASYVFARGRFPGKKFLYLLMLSTMFISLGSSTLFPQLQIAKAMNIHRTIFGVILIRLLGLPVTQVVIGKAYIEGIDRDIDNAAKIDGCSFFRIYWNIIFPLLKPLIATIGLLSFRASWNDYLMPMIFTIANPNQQPLVVGVINLKSTGESTTAWNLMMAGTMVAIIPMLIVYFALNKYFIKGLTAGSVKG